MKKKESDCSKFRGIRVFFLLLYLKYLSLSFGYPGSDKTISRPEMYLGSKYPYWIHIVLTSGAG